MVATRRQNLLMIPVVLAFVAGIAVAQPIPVPPNFLPPSPCGQTLTVGVGSLLTFDISAAANTGDPVEFILVDGVAIPAGATHTPPLPVSTVSANAQVSTTFNWTPTAADVGLHNFGYIAVNQYNLLAFCNVSVNVIAPPVFTPQTPCNLILNASAGVPITFDVTATGGGSALALVLASPLPAGATHNPPLPLFAGNTPGSISSTFTWTPGPAQLGTTVLTYFVFNELNQASVCTITIQSAECYLFLGLNPDNVPLGNGDTLLVDILAFYPVTMEAIPVFDLPNDPALNGVHIYAQIGMLNPIVFPNDPLQMSHSIEITIGQGWQLFNYGGSGITMGLNQLPLIGSQLAFHFAIPGMG